MGFLGEFTYKVDDKGRVPLPPRFREELQNGMVLTKGVDKCIRIYPPSEWEKTSAKVSAMPDTAENRSYKRTVFAGAFETKMDRLGRIPLQAELRRYADIGDTAVVSGLNTVIELWNNEKWAEQTARGEAEAWNTAEKNPL